ncbi:ABC transporter permease [Thalassomonas actiniarum]|uniref:ABC transporter permease n=1 Tax=Thalassomonas actiniarum TaxID=485447 RepID=A0AAE9YPS6_9GAMM|nr:ABC transporter permease [Thalassomonas actiniarum]WDD98248.1 ABC transporter permease [Thalassomonas actiniarum]
MLNNYIKTALRSINKNKQHFFLNLIGFSIGIAAAILMALFAQHELSYDKHQPDSERVYLAHTDYTSAGLQVIASSGYSHAEKLTSHSQVEEIFRLAEAGMLTERVHELVQLGDNYYRLNNFYAVTNNILNFIHLETVAGDIEQALSQPNQLVLSEREANRIFGESQVVGQSLNFDQGQYRIGAVFKDLPENTHVKFDSLIQMPVKFSQNGYGFAYFKLVKNTDIASFEQQFTELLHESWGENASPAITMKLINMQDMHLEGQGPLFMKKAGSSSILQICIGLSLILVLVASINFINLNIAQSAKRAKEVGVRKALGASKGQIIAQFLTESLLVVTFASLLAFTLVEFALPHFNQMMDRQLSLQYGSEFMLMTVMVIFSVGLLSGFYPALFIASFSAKRVLSGDLVRGGTAIFVRKLTLCLQGVLSIGLIIAAISFYQQINLINSLAVGYAKSSRLVVKELPTQALYKKDNNSLLTAIRNVPGVEQVTITNTDLTNDMEYNFDFTWPNGEKIDSYQPTVGTGYYAAQTLGLTLIAGRDFSPEFSGDWYTRNDENNPTVGVLVSRRMVELAGYQTPESAIGLLLIEPRFKVTAKVVGVVEDVKIGSARQQALPVSFNLGFNSNATGHLVIKTNTADMAQLSREIQQIVRQELHLSDVQISLIAQDYADAHQNEHRALDMVSIFSLLAIFLTCLGTFGLASFATIRRQKEVAVRKVLGASRLSIVNLLAKEFLFLVALSIIIAFPLSYWLVGDWLANFNDRIEQMLWVYLLAAGIIAMITWLTVAVLGFKSASARPSLILRYE